MYLYWIYTVKNWWIYVNKRVSSRPLGPGLGKVHFLRYVLVLNIYCQQLGNICQFEIYIGIEYILSTIGGHMSVRKVLKKPLIFFCFFRA